MKSIKKIEFNSDISIERSITPTLEYVGNFLCTMELYTGDGTLDEGSGVIEWDIPDAEMTEHIGVWWNEDKELYDYDGVFSMPDKAIELMESLGINCDYAKD